MEGELTKRNGDIIHHTEDYYRPGGGRRRANSFYLEYFSSAAAAKIQKKGWRYARWINWKNKILYLGIALSILLWLQWTLTATNTLHQDAQLLRSEKSLVRGRCGRNFPLPSGAPSKCDSGSGTCCNRRGWCSHGPDECLCDECTYYEWEEIQKYMPEDLPMVDDNSDLTLLGYKNILIEPKINCDDNKILIVVYTAINNFRYRQMIRLTWGNDKFLRHLNASLLFVVGRYPNLKIQLRLEQEGRKYNDILQGDYFEDYFLLAYKSLSWLHWSSIKCSKLPWIIKTDDDMVNNIWKMGYLVEALQYQKNTITCSTKTEKVIREKTGTRIDKWVIPFEEWSDEYFPTNCWGVVYIMSEFVRNKLLQAFESSNGGIFRVDDVFITGMLAERANVSHRDISDVITFYEDWDEDVVLSGNVWFAHIPPDNERLHKKRYWLWRRMVEHEFPHTYSSVLEIDTSRL